MKKLPGYQHPPAFLSRSVKSTPIYPPVGPGKGIVAGRSVTELALDSALGKLHPAFRDSVLALLMRCEDEQLPFVLYEGFRSPDRQAYLYEQGRTRPGEKVTDRRRGDSLHQYGLAADLALMIDGEITWDRSRENQGYWEALEILAPMYSLQLSGECRGHVECTFIELSDVKRGLLPGPGSDGKEWWDNICNHR